MNILQKRVFKIHKNLRFLPQKCQRNINSLDQVDVNQQIKETKNLFEFEKEALDNEDFFGVKQLFTIKDLFENRVHLGHKEGSLDNRMLPFLYGSRQGQCIFNLDITKDYLVKALNVAAHIAYRDGIIVFFNRNAFNSHLVERYAEEAGQFSHTRFWRGGIFTNANIQFGSITRLPDLCIFLNTQNNVLTQHAAVRDSAKMSIPSIGIVDSNCNPSLITYPVPGNDDSYQSIQFYCEMFKKAVLLGKEKRRDLLQYNKN
ncbi:MRPS2 family protein [Megaselia abdita]